MVVIKNKRGVMDLAYVLYVKGTTAKELFQK